MRKLTSDVEGGHCTSGGVAGGGGVGTGGTAVAVTSPSLVAGGSAHMCAVVGGRVFCWGSNGSGQLGNGTTVDSPSAVAVASLTDVVSISASEGHTCAVRRDGTVACWGDGSGGQVAPVVWMVASTPVVIPSLTDAVSVATGEYLSCAVRSNGQLACWGAPNRIPPGTSQYGWFTPADEALTDVATASANDYTLCAVRRNGTVVCWTPAQTTEWTGVTNAVSRLTNDYFERRGLFELHAHWRQHHDRISNIGLEQPALQEDS